MFISRPTVGIFLLLFVLAAFSLPIGAQSKAKRPLLPALEFEQDSAWLNVEKPLEINELLGKVVILDFWTYGCINCIHVLEDLDRLQKKYGNKIAIIGVHSPKFDNEKNLETLRRIIIRYDIKHPVVSDTNHRLAGKYGMRAWPTQYVITPQGKVLGKITGEGNYELFEMVIDKLLKEQTEPENNTPLPIVLEKDKLQSSFLAFPGKIAASDQYVAISDTLHNRVIITNHKGKVLHIVGNGSAGLVDGSFSKARFKQPQGLTFANEILYVADTGNHSVRAIDLTRDSVKTIAGTGKITLRIKKNKPATKTALRSPWDLVIWQEKLIIAMAGEHQIWALDLQQKTLEPFSGNGREALVDGSLMQASYNQPSGLSLYQDKLYVADSEASAVREIDLGAKNVRTLVGKGLFDFGDKDGELDEALLQHNLGVAAIDDQHIFVADTYNHKLKRLDINNNQIETVAVQDQIDNPQSDQDTALNEPGGLAVLNGTILIADTNNHRIMQYKIGSKELSLWPILVE